MASALIVATLESLWLARRCRQRGAFDEPVVACVDGATAAVGLVALAGATSAADRTSWVNWMAPLAYTTSGAMALALDVHTGGVGAGMLGATYLATVAPSLRTGGSIAATGLANALSYGGFFLATHVVVGQLRRNGVELDAARSAAIERAGRLAAERERLRQHRLVHDSALQTLEAVAAGFGSGSDTALQRRAQDEGALLRAALAGYDGGDRSLSEALVRLVGQFDSAGLLVELDVSALERATPRPRMRCLV